MRQKQDKARERQRHREREEGKLRLRVTGVFHFQVMQREEGKYNQKQRRSPRAHIRNTRAR